MASLILIRTRHRFMRIALLLFFAMAALALAGGIGSAIYTEPMLSVDAGGLRSTSGNYSNDGAMSDAHGGIMAGVAGITNRPGYAGQLYEVTAFTLTAPSTNLNAGASMPLAAVQFLDDGTAIFANGFAQWSSTGPIAGISASGIVTAGSVPQNTPAVVQASLEGWSAALNLMVLNESSSPGYNQIALQHLGGGVMRLAYGGQIGGQYALDRSYNLSPPVAWVPQMTNMADATGLVVYTNLANTTTNNFWRVRPVP
jgi:hypothetical protein